jgi:hypothetical protein
MLIQTPACDVGFAEWDVVAALTGWMEFKGTLGSVVKRTKSEKFQMKF